MNSSLITLDGFPRDDIDVLAVRHARVRLIELRNDRVYSLSLWIAPLLAHATDGLVYPLSEASHEPDRSCSSSSHP